MTKSVWLNYPGDNGCAYNRILLPTRFCREDMARRGVTLTCGDGLPPGHDVYVVNGLPPAQMVYDIANLKRKGATVVWSVDDDWLTVPEWNPANPGEGGLVTYEIMKNVADHVVVSTPYLATTFTRPNVHTCPNLMDLSRFPQPEYQEDDTAKYMVLRPKTPVRIVWAGSHTHSKDVAELIDPLEEVCAKFLPGKIEVVFFGMAPPGKLLTKYLHRGLYHQPSCPLATYQQVLNSIDAHVYLAPLAQVPFNLSKSSLRILEAWGLMAVPVATNWGEYGTITGGVDGRLAGSPGEWVSAISRLVTDHETRVRLALTGRMRVEQQYNWAVESCRSAWVEMFAKVCGVEQ